MQAETKRRDLDAAPGAFPSQIEQGWTAPGPIKSLIDMPTLNSVCFGNSGVSIVLYFDISEVSLVAGRTRVVSNIMLPRQYEINRAMSQNIATPVVLG